MSMIFFACVVRVRDGLPLSASTDFHFNQDFLECRKRLKVLSSILAQYPSRGTAKGRDLSIHFLSSGDIACMAICSSNYSTIMAFCFLEELQWEFAASYDATSISLASRPYAFLEFDNIIQKVKCHFNCASGSQTKANWEKIEEELKFQPPVQLKLEDTELMNGMANGGHAGVHVEVVPTYRMQRVTPLGILSLVLNIMCGALNLIRGVHLAEYSFQEDHEGIGNVVAFFLPFLACVFQCYLYLFYSSARKVKTFVLFFSVCLCNIYLYGLRNLCQIAFHIGVASLSSYQILTRQLMEKQPDCGV
ncbi:vesicle-trafficking protein SEC22c [Tyto alba]|uniref:vesicle-trafficking protein SEC22c n=1 Tax=Tyto alba TaxID=56313 RepID=UPI001401E4D4|nr:vesicle-trafficking protein SEC22c [Tyto alba]XP_032867373.1 vesicle-trafficking protein SEC22c [Tyto alba]XP_032867382.1 vesicle-trafficking protein SEC22c [Tyto alba]XP_032867392.1 vesicle-trafficking protein SEC22c [Tyto alba]XP_042657970.1 vesicle-trafficking protein SEC22c [Tyto alba]XP_042657972.1 vesicle-trafficking protein SEC22c [Tyto alba]